MLFSVERFEQVAAQALATGAHLLVRTRTLPGRSARSRAVARQYLPHKAPGPRLGTAVRQHRP